MSPRLQQRFAVQAQAMMVSTSNVEAAKPKVKPGKLH